jgi:hypothetical protein
MEFWSNDVVTQIYTWDRKGPPLLLVGPSGIGKTTAAETLLKNFEILRYYPTNFHDSKVFLTTLDEVVNHKSIMSMMRIGKPKALLIEDIDKTSSSEKSVLSYIMGLKKPGCPIILTAQKPEKRHRELLRSCYTVRIPYLSPLSPFLTKPMKKAIELGETDLRKIMKLLKDPNWKSTKKSEEISELAFQLLRGDVTDIPETVSLTEKSILVMTILENLEDTLPEWFMMYTDRALSRIFHDERWDLVRVLDDYIFPQLIREIHSKRLFVKKPFFTRNLSYNSTRALNRKTFTEKIGQSYDDPLVGYQSMITRLPQRFRIHSLYNVTETSVDLERGGGDEDGEAARDGCGGGDE